MKTAVFLREHGFFVTLLKAEPDRGSMSSVKCADLSALIVDDHMIMRQHVRANLAKLGFTDIDEATTSAEAEEKMAARRYDILFLDWVMPGKSGYNLLQKCREDSAYNDVAFVMVTSQTEERHMVEAMKAGATAYIVKPFMPAAFQARIEPVLEWISRVRLKNNS